MYVCTYMLFFVQDVEIIVRPQETPRAAGQQNPETRRSHLRPMHASQPEGNLYLNINIYM